jgi:hypothetical protein
MNNRVTQYLSQIFACFLNVVPKEIQQKCIVSLMPLISSMDEISKKGQIEECELLNIFKKNINSIVLDSCKPYVVMVMIIFLIPIILYICLFYYYKKTIENRKSDCYNKKTFNFLKLMLLGQFVLFIVNAILLLNNNIVFAIPIINTIIGVIYNLVLFKFLMIDTKDCESSNSKIKLVLKIINIFALIGIIYNIYILSKSNILKCM